MRTLRVSYQRGEVRERQTADAAYFSRWRGVGRRRRECARRSRRAAPAPGATRCIPAIRQSPPPLLSCNSSFSSNTPYPPPISQCPPSPTGSQFRTRPAPVPVLVPVPQAHLYSTRFTLERVDRGEFFLAPNHGTPFRPRRVRTRVALASVRVVPFEGDMDALADNVLHAFAAQRAHDAGRVLAGFREVVRKEKFGH